MVNTPFGHGARGDGYELRLAAVRHGVAYATTIAAAQALAAAMETARDDGLPAIALQDLPDR
jgi:carbamoyl-phosphate synthase large subunit